MFARLLLVVSLLVAFTGAITPTIAAPAAAKPLAQRWIIRFADPPLAQAAGISPVASLAGKLAPAGARGRLQISSARAQQYRSALDLRQTQAFAQIQRLFPASKLLRRYGVVFNGMAVTLPKANAATIERLRALPGVAAVYPEVQLKPTMFSSIPLIGADALWSSAAIGGQANAGAGIKIAVIDQGIKIDNPFFNPAASATRRAFPRAIPTIPRPR